MVNSPALFTSKTWSSNAWKFHLDLHFDAANARTLHLLSFEELGQQLARSSTFRASSSEAALHNNVTTANIMNWLPLFVRYFWKY